MRNILLIIFLASMVSFTDTGPYFTFNPSKQQTARDLSPEDEDHLLRDVLFFREQIERKQNDPGNYYNLGLAALNLGKLSTAEAAFKVVVGLRPEDSETFYNLGVVHARQHNYDEAIKAFSRCISMNPEHAGAHYNMGLAYQYNGKLVEAIKTLAQATALEPGNARFHYTRGSVEQKLGAYTEAAAEPRSSQCAGCQ